MVVFYCVCFLTCFSIFPENNIYILIHGTWAQEATWYREGGDFFDTLSCVIDKSDEIISFSWSGNCSDTGRRAAAIELVILLEKAQQKNKKIVIIAHSHGGNVVLHALSYMQHHCTKNFIDTVFLLGTPICHSYESKNVPVFLLINIFSFGDLIQPVFGLFKRTLPFYKNSINISITIHGKEPTHNQLYHPLFSYYIPHILKKCKVEQHDFTKLYELKVHYKKPPEIFEGNYKTRLREDQLFQEYLLSHLLWGPEEALYFLP